jgi:hypothetical protein
MSETLHRMQRSWLVVVVALCGLAFAGSCAGSEEEPAGLFSEPCSGAPASCVSGLMCVNGQCTTPCTNNAPCLPFSPTAICDTYCYEPCETNQCSAGLVCKQVISNKRTCRVR